jgi:hypothetical protein
MKSAFYIAAILCASTLGAHAGEASDAVRVFYDKIGSEIDADMRDRFVDPARTKLDQNDQAPEGEVGCVDGVLGLDAQDFDEAVVQKSLKLAEEVSGDTASVTATLNVIDGDPAGAREIVWSLKSVDGVWKIADIESKTSGLKLSEFECQ